MGTLFLFFISIFTAFAETPYKREQCLNEARFLIIAAVTSKGPMIYDTDEPVIKYADNFCNCFEKNSKGPETKQKLKDLCQKEAGEDFKKTYGEMFKQFTKKETTKRVIITACIPEKLKDYAARIEKSSLASLTPEEKFVLLSVSALATCECFSTVNVDFAFKGYEEKKELTKDEETKIQEALKSVKQVPEGKEKIAACVHEGKLLLPLSAITAYDNPQVYIQECTPLVTTLSFSSDADQDLAKKYADLVCQCAHPKLKGNETRANIAKICHQEAVTIVGEDFKASMKQTYKETFRRDLEVSCQGKINDLINQKIESSNLKSLKTESKERIKILAMDSYCKCTGTHEIENTFTGISDAKTLSPEEDKLLKRNRSEYEKSYKRHKNNEACVEESLTAARKKLADEIRTKGK